MDTKPMWLADYVDRTLHFNNHLDDGSSLSPDIQVEVDGETVIESFKEVT